MSPLRIPVYFYLLLLCGLLVTNVHIYGALSAEPVLRVSVHAAGKGSTAIVRGAGKTLVIDTGSDASVLRALGEALPPWERTIDAVVLTGDKSLYSGGLSAIESRYNIKNRMFVGTQARPYGSALDFNQASLTVIAPGVFTLSYGSASLLISSTTPEGTYLLK